MSTEAIYPDGRRELIFQVPHYDFRWQETYFLKNQFVLPKGTKLITTAYFDNSANNLLNPDPTKAIRWGEPSNEEMMGFWLAYADITTAASKPKVQSRQRAGALNKHHRWIAWLSSPEDCGLSQSLPEALALSACRPRLTRIGSVRWTRIIGGGTGCLSSMWNEAGVNIPERVEYPLEVTHVPAVLRPGDQTTLILRVTNPLTQARVRSFEVVHEKLIHLFIVSEI